MSTPRPYDYQPDDGAMRVPWPHAPHDGHDHDDHDHDGHDHDHDHDGDDGRHFEGLEFELLNVKWGSPVNGTPSGVVTWSFATSNLNVQPGDVDYNLNTSADYQRVVRNAFEAWEAVANIDFVEVADSSASQIRVGFGPVDGAGSTIGVAYYSSFGGTLRQVHIIFDSADYNGFSNTSELYLTALHEIGHAIGLGHEDDALAIMSSFINTSLTGLTVDDINGVQTIYGGDGGGVVLDDYAPDTTGTNGSLVVGATLTGEIELSGDQDWFAVEVEQGREYQFDLKGVSLSDTYLELRGSQGQLFFTDDDSGPGLDSRIVFTSGITGTVYIVASGFSTRTGSYELTVQDVTPVIIPGITVSEGTSDSPGDTTGGDQIISGDTYVGSLRDAGDQDYVRIELAAGTTYTFEMKGADSDLGTLTDPVLAVRNGDGNFLVENDDSGTGLDARLVYTPTVSGTYYLAARTDNGISGGTYTLTTTPGERVESDSTVTPATAVSETSGDALGSVNTRYGLDPGDTFEGTLSSGSDRDYVRVELTARYTYTFDLQGEDSGQGTLNNPLLVLRDSDGNVITQNHDGGTGLDSRLVFTAAVSGTYFLSAETPDPQGGTYMLSASLPVGPTPLIVEEGPVDASASIQTDVDLPVGDTFEGELSTALDVDFVRIELTAGSRYVFDLKGNDSGDGTLADPFLVLRDSEGAVLRQNEDGGTLSASRIAFMPEESGTYYLSAQSPAVGGGAGTYTLFTEQTITPFPGIEINEGDEDVPSSFLTDFEIFPNGRFVGNLETNDDIDAVQIQLEAGTRYTFDLRGADTGHGTLGQSHLRLEDSDGNSVAQDDGAGFGGDTLIVYTAPTTAKYILTISATSFSGGTYDLLVTSNSPNQSAEVTIPADSVNSIDEGYTLSGDTSSEDLASLVDVTQLGL